MRKPRVPALPALLACVLGLGLVAFSAAPAGAGGWAVTSLDPLEAPVPAEPLRVGFTVLQHGRMPVDAADGGDYGVVVRSPGRAATEFDAHPDGTPGHFVADVTFPAAGTYTWAIRQGPFGTWELGELVVEGPSPAPAATARASGPLAGEPAAAPTGDGRAPLTVRLLLPAVAVAALALLVLDVARRPAARATPARVGA